MISRASWLSGMPIFAIANVIASLNEKNRVRQLSVQRFEGGQQLVRRGRYVADAAPGRIVDGVENRGRGAADPQLADALAAQRAAVRIGLVEKHHVQRTDVGVH